MNPVLDAVPEAESTGATAPAAPGAAATLRELIEAQALAFGDKPYLLRTGEGSEPESETQGDAPALTFAALRDDCRELARRFARAGLRPGDIVSVCMGNGLQTARLILAAMYGGLVVNPINLLCQPAQLQYIVEHSDTRMIFVSPAMLPALTQAVDAAHAGGMRRPVALVCVSPDDARLPDIPTLGASHTPRVSPTPAGQDMRDVALLMYTSGTTGLPKGVLLTHGNLLANAGFISAEHRLTPDDRVLAALPLYHINGLVVTLLTPLFHGGSVVMAPKFSARTFWRDVVATRCSWINVVPTIVAYLLDGEMPDREALASLRFCRSASAALPGDHHRAFEARFGIGIIETMGMTETAAPVFSNPFDASRRRVGSIGLPSGGEAKVVRRDGTRATAGETGELVLRGAQVMRGYYKRPEETAAAFTSDGWLRTGDLGYCDEDGYFYITGRAKELIIKGGENIAPREIDEALLRHPGVLDAAAVGVPDPAYGQEIVAFVVVRERTEGSVDAAALREHCLQTLGRYKTPKEFRFVTDLPRGPSGKVQRLKLLQP
ncbi:AMP-binding protein [Pandoraea nosoerga]|nr:AMP-binding protein [Pandoraea nosoerga]MBN4665229.1 AMP-binding protein [Pandoraea nosoerga]MBN4674630.1 AMP-binding protein [Pandoraea nosoerga]MBN4680518.1 AMP-binding protein [Pandoraea nosoerga]MBN4743923.1 AMP-binding protein [Pandoraea nosoerga]